MIEMGIGLLAGLLLAAAVWHTLTHPDRKPDPDAGLDVLESDDGWERITQPDGTRVERPSWHLQSGRHRAEP